MSVIHPHVCRIQIQLPTLRISVYRLSLSCLIIIVQGRHNCVIQLTDGIIHCQLKLIRYRYIFTEKWIRIISQQRHSEFDTVARISNNILKQNILFCTFSYIMSFLKARNKSRLDLFCVRIILGTIFRYVSFQTASCQCLSLLHLLQ